MRGPLVLLLAAAFAAGCAWTRPKEDPTEFFVLEGLPAPKTLNEPRPQVELAEVELPEYLKNPRMATRSRDTEIEYAEFRRWGEPLAQGISRVIKEDLAPAADVQQPAAAGRAPRYRLSVRLSAFEGVRLSTGAGSTRVEAAWELQPAGKGAPPVQGRFSAAPAVWDGKDYGRLARLESDALSALCEDLGRAIRAAADKER
jgi:uncharacterized lipoprotein YmbA